jgi:RNA-directed DNA polymerase
MTATRKEKEADAPPDLWESWKTVDWPAIRETVRRLQVRIAKAVQEGKWRKVRSLQWLLTHSRAAKFLAVKRVTTNKGKKTPGVDGVIWSTLRQKWEAVLQLRRRGYRPLPLRRIYIPKKNGRKRPLSIPCMSDRAMQALYKLALDPVAETLADRNSYGFRWRRRCADAIQQCFIALAKGYSAVWVLEGDIRACFDGISHSWLLANIPMDREVLAKWLKAGYIEGQKLYPTSAGTPQGGIASPVLANITLDGLEEAVRRAVPRRILGIRCKVHVIRYADDFVITASSKEILVERVLPALRAFLAERGLALSEEKTRITRIEDGFDFLGQTLRKQGPKKLLIRPSKGSVKSLLASLKETMRRYRGSAADGLIKRLNSQIRGWATYHRHVASADTFCRIDTWLFHSLWRWIRRRHPKKNTEWLKKKYWSLGDNGWFGTLVKTKKGHRLYRLIRTTSITIVRHIKVRGEANPFDPKWDEYFRVRQAGKKSYLAKGSKAWCEAHS